MKQFYSYSIFFIFFLASISSRAQNITGTWEGYMDGEYLLVSVEQKGSELCGYTYDYELKNKASHCIAAYVGRYDREREVWYTSGRTFLENSGSHVFMRIVMWRDPNLGKNSLKAVVYTGSAGAFFGMGGDEIVLTKKSSRPRRLPGQPECFPPPPKRSTPSPERPAPKPVVPPATTPKPRPTVPKPVTPKPVPVPVKPVQPKPAPKTPARTDTVRKILPPAASSVKAKPEELLRKMNERKQQQQSRLEVNVKRINLKVYDNGVVDNDTVSIFYNGKLLVSHQRLSEQAFELNIDLDDNTTEHTITMFAENLGGIPPNTAVIVVTAGDKRYELRSKASLEENAVLVFDYRPKP